MKRVCRYLILMMCAILLTGCATPQASAEIYAMDTFMELSVVGNDAETALDQTKALIRQIDEKYSISSVAGEMKQLLDTGVLNSPSEGLLEMLECAKLLYERTGGAYDVTAYALSEAWGFYSNRQAVPSDEQIDMALTLVGMDRIEFDSTQVKLNGVKGIDLGSIAKGYTGKRIAQLLSGLDVDCAIMTLGGNVVTVGSKADGEKFKIGISDPADIDNICGYVTVGQTNIVTSGKYNRAFTDGQERYHHIIDARTGVPCENGVAQVTVICDDGMWADALSTALFLLGEQGALDYYEQYGGFEAVIVLDDGSITLTEGAKAIFTAV